jgi:Right handed beta helix region
MRQHCEYARLLHQISHERTLSIVTLLVLTMLFSFGCEELPIEPDAESPFVPVLELIIPATVPPGIPVPYMIVDEDANPRSAGWEIVNVSTDAALFAPQEIVLKRGAGSGQLNGITDDTTTVSITNTLGSFLAERTVQVQDLPRREMPVYLYGTDLNWGPDSLIVVRDHVIVPDAQTLTIEAGTIVLLGANARLDVDEANLEIKGTREQPVLFTAENPAEPWGELELVYSQSTLEWVFFTGGGGDNSRAFGHSNSQPVIRIDHGNFNMNHGFILDNPGKAMGSLHAEVRVDSSLISRNDTGGEHGESLVIIENTWFLDTPNGDGIPIDDDNDAIYLRLPHDDSDLWSVLRNCVFVTGKDDAIDHNGANVMIEHCVIEGFDNEGLAASNENTASVYNTLILDCEQGIEAGYGSPEVIVDHCVITGCDTGLRFGDNYPNQDHTGSLTVTNTISVGNRLHNVWNFDPATELPSKNAVEIYWSIVNDPEYDDSTGNISGEVKFDLDYLLLEGSVGVGAAIDSTDIGLLHLLQP